jgi:hypothetical protein
MLTQFSGCTSTNDSLNDCLHYTDHSMMGARSLTSFLPYLIHISVSLQISFFFPLKGQHVLPKLVHRWLSPRALAYWFMFGGLQAPVR